MKKVDKSIGRPAKRKLAKAKERAYNELYKRLDTEEGEKDLY